MKDGQLLRVKVIKSSKDLPEKESLYYCSYNDKIIWMWFRQKDWNIQDWLDNVNWYLQPIEITDADIKAWAYEKNPLSAERYQSLIEGAKAAINDEIKHIEK